MAQPDTKQTTISGNNYVVSMLDPLIASDLLVEFGQLVGPALEHLKDEEAKEGGEKEEADGLAALGDILRRLTSTQVRSLIAAMGEVSVIKNGDKELQMAENVVREHFRGKLGDMYRWLAFAIKTNFGDFFSSIKPVIAQGVHQLGLGR